MAYVIGLFIPKKATKEYRKIKDLLKEEMQKILKATCIRFPWTTPLSIKC